jgi:hypothetical protein
MTPTCTLNPALAVVAVCSCFDTLHDPALQFTNSSLHLQQKVMFHSIWSQRMGPHRPRQAPPCVYGVRSRYAPVPPFSGSVCRRMTSFPDHHTHICVIPAMHAPVPCFAGLWLGGVCPAQQGSSSNGGPRWAVPWLSSGTGKCRLLQPRSPRLLGWVHTAL